MLHPDEGLIHAWLDGELEPAEAARVSELVSNEPAWGAAAAEARGLIAASSRIAGSLDRVPGTVIPRTKRAPRATRWWMMRAAALIVVVAGAVTVARREPPELVLPATMAPVGGGSSQPVSGARSDAAASPPARSTGAVQKKATPTAKPRATAPTQPAATALSELAKGRPAATPPAALKAPESPIPSPPTEAQRREASALAAGSSVERLQPLPRSTDASAKGAAEPLRAALNAAPAIRCFTWSQPADSASRILRISAAALADSVRHGVWFARGDSLLAPPRRLVARSIPCP